MSANGLSRLDAPQVIKSVYDETKRCLRVCVVDGSPGDGGGIEVIIDHTEDSIRLGDGTNFFSSSSINGKLGLDVNDINASVGSTGNSNTINTGVANTESSFNFPVGTKWIKFQSRNKGTIRYGYASGQRNISVPPGNFWPINDINTTATLTMYFSSSKSGDIIEIEYWV